MSDGFHQSAQKIIKDDMPTVRKSLIIGLGGSGMKGINSAKKYMEKNMPREARRYLRWIGVDTTDIGTSIEGKGTQYRFPGKDQMYQDDVRSLYIGAPTPAELSVEYLRKIREEEECYSWFPDPDVYAISTRAGQGANQTRCLGRLAFFANYTRIRDALVKERDKLTALSNDPRYFKLLDVQEKSGQTTDKLKIVLKANQNRYYITDNVPDNHEIVSLEMDEASRLLLCPNVAADKVAANMFPLDDKGRYFEVNPKTAGLTEMNFVVKHAPREGGISIFITGSIVGGTGNGMFLDFSALVHEIFKDFWPTPKIYGIVVLPSAFKRVVYNANARANAYAALKEIDYFMSGNTFRSKYPDGTETVVEGRLFDDGMLYLLDVENEAGNILQDRDQVQELTGQFIYTFVASSVGGAIEERMVNDSSRASIYVPESGNEPRRRCSYNSFGVSRVTYPAPQLRDLGFKLVSLKIVKSFYRRYNKKLMGDTFGDLNRGLVRALRLNCRLIYERMYPDYKLDWKSEFRSYQIKINKALQSRNVRELVSALELLSRDYGRGEMDRLKERMLSRMEARWRIELDKMDQILKITVDKVTRDPARGFLFIRELLDLVMAKLELYQETYYEQRIGLQYFGSQEIEKLIVDIEDDERLKPKKAEAVYYMVRINYLQLIHEAMLQASEDFIKEFKSHLYKIKNEILSPLDDKLKTLATELQAEIQQMHFDLLQKVNPLYFFLVNKEEISSFVNSYFSKRLSIEDLCSDVDFLKMDKGDDVHQLIETWLIGKFGLEILEKSSDEVDEMIAQELGHEILEKTPEEVKEQLYGGGDEAGLSINDSTMTRIEVENLRSGLYKVINSRFEGFNFENLSIKKLLDERKIPVKKILERLDTFSRPYTTAGLRGLKTMEYYRTITQFELNVFEEGDVPTPENINDLPERMDHYSKRQSAEPNISVENFVVPNLCKPYEMLSIGIALGFPLFRIDGLRDSAADYHMILSKKTHPMHLFNHPSYDARYFPDPFRDRNYLNPRHFWEGLKEFKLIEPNGDGQFHYNKSLHEQLKVLQARDDYYGSIRSVIKKVNSYGGIHKCPAEYYVKVVLALGMMGKDKSGAYFFRKDYDTVIRDIIDGDGTGDRATESGLTKDEYIQKHIPSPRFTTLKELAVFLKNHASVRSFLNRDINRIFKSTMGNVTSGAAMQIPKSRINAVKLPAFKDDIDFYDYFEQHGSLEWQNLLKNSMVRNVEDIVRRFRHPDDPSLFDRKRIREYLENLEGKMPFTVSWEVLVNMGVIK